MKSKASHLAYLLCFALPACLDPLVDADIERADRGIVGGTDSANLSVVWVRLPNAQFCTGTLIRPTAVLTAGHCVCANPNQTPRTCPNRRAEVYLNGSNFNGEPDMTGDAIIYPPYEGTGTGDDLALILLDSPLRWFGTPVPPIQVQNPLVAPAVGDPVLFYGIGPDGPGCASGSDRQRYADLTISNVKIHPGANSQDYWTEHPTFHSCGGDSGGPLLDASGRIIGVTSRGNVGRRRTIFTATRQAYGWIKQNACGGFDPNYPDPHFCNDPMCPCGHGEGDCDLVGPSCASSATCVLDIGASFGLPPHYDVCIECPTMDPNNPDPNFCETPFCPCGLGEGDCDPGQGECEAGLACGTNNGADYGLPPHYEVCINPGPSCGNGQWDSGEECDDGNTTGGDGCSYNCDVESGWVCSPFHTCHEVGPGPHCPPICN